MKVSSICDKLSHYCNVLSCHFVISNLGKNILKTSQVKTSHIVQLLFKLKKISNYKLSDSCSSHPIHTISYDQLLVVILDKISGFLHAALFDGVLRSCFLFAIPHSTICLSVSLNVVDMHVFHPYINISRLCIWH